MNNNNKKLKRIHEASKKCTNITKMERHRYILIEISALFFSKTFMLCIFSAFFRRFISVQKRQEILPRNGVNVILKNAVFINAPASAGYPPAQTVNAWSLRFHSLLNTFAFFFFRYKRMYQQHTFMLRQCNMSKYHWITLLRMHVWIYRKWTELHR